MNKAEYEGVSGTVSQTRDGKFKEPSCFIPEKDNAYPLCVGNGQPQCNTCSLYAKLEAEPWCPAADSIY